MKKFLSSFMTLCLVASMAVTSLAISGEHTVTAEVKGEHPDTDAFMPGRTYYFPLEYDGSKNVSKSFLDDYTVEFEVTQGEDYITNPKIIRDQDDDYVMSFKVSTSRDLEELQDVEIEIITTEDEDEDNVGYSDVSFEVGYGGITDASDDEFRVYNDVPIVEFEEEQKGDTFLVEFGDATAVQFRHDGSQKINFFYDELPDYDLVDEYDDANLNFITFYTHPDVDNGEFRYYDSDARYVYLNDNGKLIQLNTDLEDDYISAEVEELGAFVISDERLSGATSAPSTSTSTSSSSSSTTTATTPTTTTPPKVNPSTGAKA